MEEDRPRPEPTSLEALYSAVPAAQEEDLFEQAAADEVAAQEDAALREVARFLGEDLPEEPGAALRRAQDPADWALPLLLRPDPGDEWRSALALARALCEPEVGTGRAGTAEVRLQLPSRARLHEAWRAVVVGREPDWAAVWAEAAGHLGLPVAPLDTLLARLVAVLLDADLPAPIVADALTRCLDEAGGRPG